MQIDARRRQGAFTLIELMIVVAIIGIIAAIAVPLYRSFVIRSQVAEGINLSTSAKVAATEYFQDRGVFAADNTSAGLVAAAEISGEFVSQIEIVASGDIEITYGNDAHPNISSAVLTLSPSDNDGSVTWVCTGDAKLIDRYVPESCR